MQEQGGAHACREPAGSSIGCCTSSSDRFAAAASASLSRWLRGVGSWSARISEIATHSALKQKGASGKKAKARFHCNTQHTHTHRKQTSQHMSGLAKAALLLFASVPLLLLCA